MKALIKKLKMKWAALGLKTQKWIIRVICLLLALGLVVYALFGIQQYKAMNLLIFWAFGELIWQMYYKRTIKTEGRTGIEYAAVITARITHNSVFVVAGSLGL